MLLGGNWYVISDFVPHSVRIIRKKCTCFLIGDVRDRRRERYNRVYVLSRYVQTEFHCINDLVTLHWLPQGFLVCRLTTIIASSCFLPSWLAEPLLCFFPLPWQAVKIIGVCNMISCNCVRITLCVSKFQSLTCTAERQVTDMQSAELVNIEWSTWAYLDGVLKLTTATVPGSANWSRNYALTCCWMHSIHPDRCMSATVILGDARCRHSHSGRWSEAIPNIWKILVAPAPSIMWRSSPSVRQTRVREAWIWNRTWKWS